MTITYKDSGVDKEEGYRLVEKAKAAAAKTHNPNVLNGIGSFAALYALADYKEPVLVSGTDGVGTKLAVAFAQNRYDTVGIDCVAMCVNDILCHAAKPLFFLDYIACGKLDAAQAADLVMGVSAGCEQAGCALVGGETAEMPGFYKQGDYDIAGFAVGVVERLAIVDGKNVQAGDKVIGLSASGAHSNGYSLLRRLFVDLDEKIGGKRVGDLLLTPTRIYVKSVLKTLADNPNAVHAMAHITGGGLIENLPRVLPEGLSAVLDLSRIVADETASLLFTEVAARGVSHEEMLGTFNMGVGFCLVVAAASADAVLTSLQAAGETAFILGEIEAGEMPIRFITA